MTRWSVLVTIATTVLLAGRMQPGVLKASAARQLQAPNTVSEPQSETRPAATVLQLMQSIVFANANVIFAAQSTDPESIPRDVRPSVSPNVLTSLYGGWRGIENSGLALAEAADLLNARGRTCSNGTAVPVDEVEWKTAVQAFRASALASAAAARTRNQDRIVEVTEELTNSCSACHRMYRVRGNPCVTAPQ